MNKILGHYPTPHTLCADIWDNVDRVWSTTKFRLGEGAGEEGLFSFDDYTKRISSACLIYKYCHTFGFLKSALDYFVQ